MTSKDIPNTDERFGNGHGESGWKWNKIDGVEAVGMGGKTAGKNRFLETTVNISSIDFFTTAKNCEKKITFSLEWLKLNKYCVILLDVQDLKFGIYQIAE